MIYRDMEAETFFDLFDNTPTQYVEVAGIRLAYQTFASVDMSAPVVLLIVGHGGQLHYWGERFILKLCEAGYRVVAFDNRDAGLSDKLDGLGRPNISQLWYQRMYRQPISAPYTLETMAGDAIGLMDALDLKVAHIVGASMGGMIGQIMASHFPERVRSLTSIMSSSGAPHLPEPGQAVLALMRALKSPGRNEQRDHELSVAFWRAIGSDTHTSAAYFDALVSRTVARSSHPSGLDRQLAALWASGDRSSLLRKVSIQTHVIHGREDSLFPLAHGMDVAAKIQDARFTAINDMGHAFQPQIIDHLADSVINFLQGIRPRV